MVLDFTTMALTILEKAFLHAEKILFPDHYAMCVKAELL